MAGGSGDRFWPKSRKLMPKQFLPITGAKPMIENTVNRLKNIFSCRDIIIITGDLHAKRLKNILPCLPASNIIGEPEARNTAACAGLAAVKLREDDAVMMLFPSDHVIKPEAEFRRILKHAALIAENTDNLITIGIKPTCGSTAYGYIKQGKAFKDGGRAIKTFFADGFFEKPDKRTAERFSENGGYLWNSGIFVWRKKVILAAMKKHLPDVYRQLLKLNDKNIKRVYPSIRKISIDYGIMEKAKNVLVVEAGFSWNDVGSWEALGACFKKDKRGNIKQGSAIDLNGSNNMIFAEAGVVVTIGVSDLIVVSTGDATLVLKNGSGEEVKNAVEMLRRNKALKKYAEVKSN